MTNMYRPDADGGYPADAAVPGSAWSPRRRLRWGAGIILAAFLVGGGITLTAVSAGSTAAAGPVSSSQGAQLNTALTDAGSAGVPAARVRRALGRIRHLGGVEGTATFRNKKGFHTLSFERGSIQSVSGGDVVIKSPDGTTWTWKIVSDTMVRKNGGKTTASALSAGETVFAGGPVVSGARDARLIVIKPAAAPGTSGSQSAQTSLS